MTKTKNLFLKLLFPVLVFCLLPLHSSSGGLLPHESTKDQTLYSGSQDGLIVYDQGKQELFLNLDHEYGADNFVWLVPVPGYPEVEEVDANIFNQISDYDDFDQLTIKPKEEVMPSVERWPDDIHDISILSSGEVYDWLQEKSYLVNQNTREVLDNYIAKNWHFVALRINPPVLDDIISDLSQDLEKEVTVENLGEELSSNFLSSILEEDVDKFRLYSRLLLLLGIDDLFFRTLEEIENTSREEVAEELASVSSEMRAALDVSGGVLDEFLFALEHMIDLQMLELEPDRTLNLVVEEFDQAVDAEITRDNFLQQFSNYLIYSIRDGDLEKFRIAFNISSRFTSFLLEEFLPFGGESFEESFEEVFQEFVESDFFKEDRIDETILETRGAVGEAFLGHIPVRTIDVIVKEFDQEVRNKVTRDNLARELSEYFVYSSLEEDIDRFKTALGYLADLFVFDNLEREEILFITSLTEEEIKKHEVIEEFFEKELLSEEHTDFLLAAKEVEFKQAIQAKEAGKKTHSVKIAFETDSPIYPLNISKVSPPAGEEELHISLYILTRDEYEVPAGWSLAHKKEEVIPRQTNVRALSYSMIWDDDGHFVLSKLNNSLSQEELGGDLYFQTKTVYQEPPEYPGFEEIDSEAQELRQRLKGRILLQVEEQGQAYYINPDDLSLHFLGRPSDAFQIMREQGLGISNDDINRIQPSLKYLRGKDSDGDGLPDDFERAIGTDPHNPDTSGNGYTDKTEIKHGYDPLKKEGRLPIDEEFAKRQAGKILLQVEQNGEAWYINPEDNQRYFLGRPADAFEIMRNLGLGISNQDFEVLSGKTTPPGDPNNGTESDQEVVMYYFWGDGCPICGPAEEALNELEEEHPELTVKKFEVYKNQDNADFFERVAEAYDTLARGVPTVFIGEEVIVGFGATQEKEIIDKIEKCLEETCVSPGDRI